jgi:hypothetical protein
MVIHDVVHLYQVHIQEPGKQPLFLLLVGFVGSFLFIRFSVRMIRRGTRWWPGNVTPGGLHIHHAVFGLFFLLLGGFGAFVTAATHPWLDAFGLVFGIGCGLVLDEFALILHLEDVYWSEQGRKSVDAVIVGICFTGLLLLGYLPLGAEPGGTIHWGLIGVLSFNALCAVITLLKGKFWVGMIGIFVPFISLIGAVRLARPTSPWARWFYGRRPRSARRARRREARYHARIDRGRQWLFDAIAGKPTPPGEMPTLTHRVTERVAAGLERRRARQLARGAARVAPRVPSSTRGRDAAARRRVIAASRARAVSVQHLPARAGISRGASRP